MPRYHVRMIAKRVYEAYVIADSAAEAGVIVGDEIRAGALKPKPLPDGQAGISTVDVRLVSDN